MNKKLLLSITILSTIPSINAFFDFDAFDSHFEQMEQQACSMRKRMNKNMRAMQAASGAVPGIHATHKATQDTEAEGDAWVAPEERRLKLPKISVTASLKEDDESVTVTLSGISAKELEATLKALQTDFIDILLFHGATNEDLLFDKSVIDFFRSAREKGLIRAFGFSAHDNQVQLVKANNRHRFYDVVMVPVNHRGGFIHSNSGWESSWDQKALFTELSEARKKGVGILAMKTCSGGPFAYDKADQPTLPGAIRWVIDQPEVDCAVVAMANYKEIAEDTGIFMA